MAAGFGVQPLERDGRRRETEGMFRRLFWPAVVAGLGLALLRGAGSASADVSTAAILYRTDGTAMGLATLTMTGTSAALTVSIKGATPSATYSVRTCLPDP